MKLIRFLALLSLSLFSPLIYAGVAVGDPFPRLTLEDQFGNEHTVSVEDRLIIMAFDMDASDSLHDFLSQQEKDFLENNRTRYIADISGMPWLISKLFALPKMRDYNYAFMLNRDEDFKAEFESQEGRLTIYRLKQGVVESVELIDGSKPARLFDN
ncbi:MAG: hypothetical protein ACX933_08360 [Marinobacter adhaerens]